MKKLLLVIFFTMFPVLAHGATYYVAKTGSDSMSCANARSQSTPKLTINAGVACLSAGDTLIVKSGIYDEALNIPYFTTVPDGSPGNPTIIKSEIPLGAIIRPTTHANMDGRCPALICTVTKSYINFDGFFLAGSLLLNAEGFIIRDDPSTPNTGSHHITMTNNESHGGQDDPFGSVGNCITLSRSSHDNYIGYNNLHDCGNLTDPNAIGSHCIYVVGYNNIIENNKIGSCSGHGVHIYNAGDPPLASNNIIRNNTIHDAGSRSMLVSSGNDNQVYNNIIYKNWQGIFIGGYGSSNQGNSIWNNTLYNNNFGRYGGGGQCIDIESSTNTVVRN